MIHRKQLLNGNLKINDGVADPGRGGWMESQRISQQRAIEYWQEIVHSRDK